MAWHPAPRRLHGSWQQSNGKWTWEVTGRKGTPGHATVWRWTVHPLSFASAQSFRDGVSDCETNKDHQMLWHLLLNIWVWIGNPAPLIRICRSARNAAVTADWYLSRDVQSHTVSWFRIIFANASSQVGFRLSTWQRKSSSGNWSRQQGSILSSPPASTPTTDKMASAEVDEPTTWNS